MKKIFYNPDTRLLRAGWRILTFLVLFLALTAGAMFGVRTVLGSLQRGSTLQFTILAVTATVAVFLARKYIDKQPLLSLGLRWDKFAILDIISGIVISALVMAGTYFVMLWIGFIEFHGFSWWVDSGSADAAASIAITIEFAHSSDHSAADLCLPENRSTVAPYGPAFGLEFLPGLRIRIRGKWPAITKLDFTISGRP
jgi:succinate dehydrogenase hydrophobic anchor subunit